MEIENWFWVPILYHDLDETEFSLIQSELSHALPQICQQDLTNPWSDTVKTSFKYSANGKTSANLVAEYDLKNTNAVVLRYAHKFLEDTQNKLNLRIKSSWVNISEKGNFQFSHRHPDSLLSAVYYYQAGPGDGDIKFKTPNPWQEIYETNPSSVQYEPRSGRLLIFLSYLEHQVLVNQNDSQRISFAFNIIDSK